MDLINAIIDWEIFIKIEYLSVFLAIPVFALFIHSLFEQDFHKLILKFIVVIGCGLSFIVIITPVKIFSTLVPFEEVFTISSMFYGTFVLLKAIKHKRTGTVIIFAGYLVFFVTIINDVLDINEIVQTGHFAPFGLLIFIFCQNFLVSFLETKAFAVVDLQMDDLQKANADLKQQSKERELAEREKFALQENRARSEKMEAIGLLAGGVAHDLNNILCGTITYPDVLLLDLPSDSPLRQPLKTIRDSGKKAAAVVQDLLVYARRNIVQFEIVNINDIVREFVNSTDYKRIMQQHPKTSLRCKLASDLYDIMGSAYHLKKTVINLIENSAAAQSENGIIKLSTSNRYVKSSGNYFENIIEGSYVVLRINDTRHYPEQGDLGKIFEPFYTKDVLGRSGTGLGMAVVWGIVHEHNGFMDIITDTDTGIVFELYFPVTKEKAATTPQSSTSSNYRGNGEKILVIDDFAGQRLVATQLLERLGYSVTTCASGEEAVVYIKSNRVDLLLLDMIMDPGMDGLETYKSIQQIQPGIKTILTSGYSKTWRVNEALALGAGRYLCKPYTMDKLGLAVKEELQSNPAESA